MKSFKDSYWLRSGFFSILQRIVIVLFGFAGFFILIRLFPKEEYGIWMLFMSFTTLTEVLRQGFIRNPLITYLNGSDEKDHNSIINASFILNVGTTVVLAAFILIFGKTLSILWNAEGLDVLLLLYVLTTVVLTFFSHYEYVLEAKLDFKKKFYVYFIRHGLFLFYILWYVYFDLELTLVNLTLAQLATIIITTVQLFFYSRKYLSFSISIDKGWIKKMFSFGKYTFGTNLSSMIMGNVDQWMLSSIISPVAVAIYNPAIRIAHLVDVPSMSVASIVFPKVASRVKEEGGKAAKYLYEKSVGLILAILLPMLLLILIFPDFVIYFIAGEAYSDSIPILQVTILYSIFIPFGRQFGIIVDGMGLPKISFYFVILKVIINVICNYFFISHFGVIGAAWGTLCSLLIGFILNTVYLQRKIDMKLMNIPVHILSFYKDGLHFTMNFLKSKFQ